MVDIILDGYAFGGGLELSLNCDFRVFTNNCLVGLPETSLAIIPGATGTQTLSRLVGLAKASQMILFGSKLKTEEASSIGLADFVVQDYENGLQDVLNMCEELNKKVK